MIRCVCVVVFLYNSTDDGSAWEYAMVVHVVASLEGTIEFMLVASSFKAKYADSFVANYLHKFEEKQWYGKLFVCILVFLGVYFAPITVIILGTFKFFYDLMEKRDPRATKFKWAICCCLPVVYPIFLALLLLSAAALYCFMLLVNPAILYYVLSFWTSSHFLQRKFDYDEQLSFKYFYRSLRWTCIILILRYAENYACIYSVPDSGVRDFHFIRWAFNIFVAIFFAHLIMLYYYNFKYTHGLFKRLKNILTVENERESVELELAQIKGREDLHYDCYDEELEELQSNKTKKHQ
eukprot:UN23803